MIVNSIGVKSPLKTPNYLYGNNSAENSRALVLGPTFRGGQMQSIYKTGTSSHKLRTLALAFLAGAATIFGASTLTSCEKDDPIKPPVDNPINNKKQSETSKALVNMWKGLGIKFNTEKSDVAGAASGDITQFSYKTDGLHDQYTINTTLSNQDSTVYDYVWTNPYNNNNAKFYGYTSFKFVPPYIQMADYMKDSISDPNPVTHGYVNLLPKASGEVVVYNENLNISHRTMVPNTETSYKDVYVTGDENYYTDVKIIQNK